MKKTILSRIIKGFPAGIFIGYMISIISSLIWAKGYYSPCVPDFTNTMGNEITAVIVQTLLTGILGSLFSVSQAIWEMDHWSICKQTGIYFLVTASFLLPISFITRWMDFSIGGILSYLFIFIIIFIAIWLTQYAIWKHHVNEINQIVHKEK